MKVLIVLYYYHPYVSGLSLLAKQEAEGLAARGHEVTVLCLRHDASLVEHDHIGGVTVIRAEVLAKFGKGGVSADFLWKIVQLAKVNNIVNPHLPMAHFGLILPFIDTTKLIPQYHCDLNLGPGLAARLLQKFSCWSMEKTLARSHKIVVTTLDYFSHCHFAGYLEKARQIYPPIDQSRFGERDTVGLRHRLGIEGSPHLIGFVGRIVAEKGLPYLIGSIPFLARKYKNFMILIAGDYENVAGGSVKDDLNALIDQHSKYIRFTGYLGFDDLISFYNLIDVLVLPSVDPLEAFGMVQLEALYCGTPVVVSDMPGVREVVNKTGYGKLVRMRDSRDIAEKVSQLREHPIEVDRRQLELFNVERSIDAYEKIMETQ